LSTDVVLIYLNLSVALVLHYQRLGVGWLVVLCRPGLLLPGVSLFGSYQFDDKAARNLKVAAVDELVSEADMSEEEAQGWGRALIFHHQWMVLAREHAAALVSMSRDIIAVSCACISSCKSRQQGMALLV
jgi:hypothetical protein